MFTIFAPFSRSCFGPIADPGWETILPAGRLQNPVPVTIVTVQVRYRRDNGSRRGQKPTNCAGV